MSSEYIPPGVKDNELYILPPVDRMLEHFRRCGGDMERFLIRHIEQREERDEVRMRFLDMVMKNEKAKKEYNRILDIKIFGLQTEQKVALMTDKRKLRTQLEGEIVDALLEKDEGKVKTSLELLDGA